MKNSHVSQIDPSWSLETALDQKGYFPLKGLAVLPFEISIVQDKIDQILATGEDTYENMGVLRYLGEWYVDMESFSQWYKTLVHNKTVRQPAADWDGNDILEKSGLFELRHVCQLIPFTSAQIRYQVKRSSSPKREIGAWRQATGLYSGKYLVDMDTFGPYIKSVWHKVKGGALSDLCFEPDERKLEVPDPKWSKDNLLGQKALFYLKDVGKFLDFDWTLVKIYCERQKIDQNIWETMGLARLYSHWIVKMARFSIWYRASIFSKIRKPDPSWTIEELLAQQDHFFLADITKALAIFINLRTVYDNPKPYKERGIWRAKEISRYVVDMSLFSKWAMDEWGKLFD